MCSVRRQLVSMLSLGAGAVGLCGLVCLFHKFPEPLSLQGTSSNFLVLRIKAHKTIRVSHAWGSSQFWERGPEKVAFVLLVSKIISLAVPRKISHI